MKLKSRFQVTLRVQFWDFRRKEKEILLGQKETPSCRKKFLLSHKTERFSFVGQRVFSVGQIKRAFVQQRFLVLNKE